MTVKKNCWEFKNCGREAGGKKAQQLGVCPAAGEAKADGIHGGLNGGRACWVLAGTYCGGQTQGSFAAKLKNCNDCDFYKAVVSSEPLFMDKVDILYHLKSQPS